MAISISGNSHPHLHHPCPRCGYATRFKQWPTRCLCNRGCSTAELEKREHHRSTNPDHLIPSAPSPRNVPPLRIADRYVAAPPTVLPSAPTPLDVAVGHRNYVEPQDDALALRRRLSEERGRRLGYIKDENRPGLEQLMLEHRRKKLAWDAATTAHTRRAAARPASPEVSLGQRGPQR
jgi:hypothetical protein